MPSLARENQCGIDFGTSNSVIGRNVGGTPRLVPFAKGKKSTPSTVFFNSALRQPFFGEAAVQMYLAGEQGRMMWSPKNILGTTLMRDSTIVDGRPMEFSMIIGQILGYLKEQAEYSYGAPFESVVLGRPVHYNDTDPALDREAQEQMHLMAIRQGFRNIAFEYEPIAAAIEYERQVTREQLALVVDIGGGTSDFTVVRLTPEASRAGRERSHDILSVGGVHVGGTTFDTLLSLRSVMPKFGMGMQYTGPNGKVMDMPSHVYFLMSEWARIDSVYGMKSLDSIYSALSFGAREHVEFKRFDRVLTRGLGHRIARAVENAKVALSEQESASIDLSFLEDTLAVAVTREFFHAAIREVLGKIDTGVRRTINDAGESAAQIDSLIFTGGCSAIPEVRRRIRAIVPDATVIDADRFGAVGMGLTLKAIELFG